MRKRERERTRVRRIGHSVWPPSLSLSLLFPSIVVALWMLTTRTSLRGQERMMILLLQSANAVWPCNEIFCPHPMHINLLGSCKRSLRCIVQVMPLKLVWGIFGNAFWSWCFANLTEFWGHFLKPYLIEVIYILLQMVGLYMYIAQAEVLKKEWIHICI